MKKVVFLALFTMALTSCGAASSTSASLSKGSTISGEDLDPNGGADAYGNAGDHVSDVYFAHPDYYNMVSNDHLTILNHFATFQQTTEYTCGPASALMVLCHLGVTSYTERSLAVGMKTSCDSQTDGLPGTADEFGEYGTSVGKMYDFFSSQSALKIVETSYRPTYSSSDLLLSGSACENDVGNLPATFQSWSPYASGLDENGEPVYVDDAKNSLFVSWVVGHLQDNLPIMVEWGDWDGHWQDIIGYDTMGTAGFGDDVIIFADPYDTSDHCQDGYYVYPAERFFYMWKDRCVAPKPFQLQPYMIIDVK